ncbi:MAG: proline--tRNA ligase [Anaerolineales bacterium]
MSKDNLPSRSENFSEWYNQLVQKAELADYAPVRGCMVVRPYGWTLWENMQSGLDRRFKETGHVNAAFPMLIPMSFFEKEQEHVEGFSPELAIVTHGGGEKLEEPLAVRPTSETIIGHMYAKWIQSYRDLPVLINQWGSVLRWEMRTKLFLRTSEFYWQEGHTAHATADEALEETYRMLDVYADFAINDAAIPVIKGIKSETEKFAGAKMSASIEAMMGDKRALQSGTSHFFGDNFARAFNIQYLDQNNTLQYCHTTSWGLSTRMIGAVIMVHGDDKGLVLPPKIAPTQVVLIPIYRQNNEKSQVMPVIQKITTELKAAGIRLKLDDRDEFTPGFKFNDWEMRGVPLRIEVGPRDIANGTVAFARRDITGRDGKSFVPQENLALRVKEILDTIQVNMLTKATAFRDENIHNVENYADLQDVVKEGWAFARWCGNPHCEAQIKADTKASSRCIPLDQPGGTGPCVVCGQDSDQKAYFAKAY